MTTPRVEEKLAYAYKLTLGQIRDELKNIIPNDLFSLMATQNPPLMAT